MKIHVVMGSCGQHDDYRTWMTIGFHMISSAETYKDACEAEARRIRNEINELDGEFQEKEIGVTEYWDRHDRIRTSNAIDESFDWDEPVEYTIDWLEVR